jgi:hypothetical protein
MPVLSRRLSSQWHRQKSATVPAALLNLNLILSPFSEAGHYMIMTVSDREVMGASLMPRNCGHGCSQTKLTETLDPCQVRPGNYVLLTELNDKRTRIPIRSKSGDWISSAAVHSEYDNWVRELFTIDRQTFWGLLGYWESSLKNTPLRAPFPRN